MSAIVGGGFIFFNPFYCSLPFTQESFLYLYLFYPALFFIFFIQRDLMSVFCRCNCRNYPRRSATYYNNMTHLYYPLILVIHFDCIAYHIQFISTVDLILIPDIF